MQWQQQQHHPPHEHGAVSPVTSDVTQTCTPDISKSRKELKHLLANAFRCLRSVAFTEDAVLFASRESQQQ